MGCLCAPLGLRLLCSHGEAPVLLAELLHTHAGFTGADLQNLMNEAAILAARRNLKEISKEEISDALERLIAGPEKKGSVMAEKKRKLVAYHEVLPSLACLLCAACSAKGWAGLAGSVCMVLQSLPAFVNDSSHVGCMLLYLRHASSA